MGVTSVVAVVYRGGGRRWMTLNAACNAEARKKISEHCQCEPFDRPCMLHDDRRYPIILRRLSGMHKRAFLRRLHSQPTTPESGGERDE